jgi:protein SDA1
MLEDSNAVAAKISLEIMMELYKKHVWKDAKTVNVIASACFSKVMKIMVTALSFFLGSDDGENDEDDDDEEDKNDKNDSIPTSKDIKEMKMANIHNKKSKKRANQLKKLEKAAKKVAKKKEPKECINFSALHLIFDPQGMAEKLLKLVQSMNERFEVKLMIMNLISRLIGVHELFVFNFYPLLQRYLQPHQRDVTKILLYAAQSCHELVPPDVIEPLLKTIVTNFVNERNSNECITVGINTTREICTRCPLVMTEDLLQDLVMYQKYKDKNVSMSARSLVQAFRLINPNLLAKKDRGRPTEATIELKPKDYRELDSKNYIPGAEVLVHMKDIAKTLDEDASDDENDWETDEEDDSGNEGWQTDDEEVEEESDEGDALSDSDDEVGVISQDKGTKQVKEEPKKSRMQENQERLKKIQEVASLVSSSRILTDEEFKLMRKNQIRKQVEAIHPRNRNMKRKEDQSDEDSVDSDAEDLLDKKEFVSLKSIERLYKKPRPDKESRLSTVLEGREGRDKFGKKREKMNPFSSTRQKEKNKNKAFSMIKYKVKGKKKESFEKKQARLRKSLIKQAKQIK